MGDKSPKSMDRQKKQAATEKEKKKAEAYAKAHPVVGAPQKKGK